MCDFASPQAAAQLPADMEAEFSSYLAQIDLLNDQIRRDQDSIDHLRSRADELKNETRTLLASVNAAMAS